MNITLASFHRAAPQANISLASFRRDRQGRRKYWKCMEQFPVYAGIHKLLEQWTPASALASSATAPCFALTPASMQSCIALDNCSCIVLTSPIHGLVPLPSLESFAGVTKDEFWVTVKQDRFSSSCVGKIFNQEKSHSTVLRGYVSAAVIMWVF